MSESAMNYDSSGPVSNVTSRSPVGAAPHNLRHPASEEVQIFLESSAKLILMRILRLNLNENNDLDYPPPTEVLIHEELGINVSMNAQPKGCTWFRTSQ
jgi:hypothetical protein